MDERINELENRYTLQEHALAELSDVVYRQAKELERLTLRLVQLEQKLAGEPGMVDARGDERPPHY